MIRNFIDRNLGDVIGALCVTGIGALFLLCCIGRVVVAVAQDIAGSARRMWE